MTGSLGQAAQLRSRLRTGILVEGGHRWDGATAVPLLARVLKRD